MEKIYERKFAKIYVFHIKYRINFYRDTFEEKGKL